MRRPEPDEYARLIDHGPFSGGLCQRIRDHIERFYSRLLSHASRRSTGEVMDQRTIQLRKENQTQKFINNKVRTSKYSLLTFLPVFLFRHTFTKYANLFFLFIGLLQQIPDVSPTGRWTTIGPLIFILLLTAIKELIEDVKRHRADRMTNYRSKCYALRDAHWTKIRWQEVVVGDYIKLENGDQVPADMVLLSSSEPQGIAYIETSNLDGETNLKIRKGLSFTSSIEDTEELSRLDGRLVCENPTRHLYEFVGTLYLDGQQPIPLTAAELLLRGSRLKNTRWIFGLVAYTGEESKLRLNSVKSPLKRSHIEKVTNIQILLLFGVLLGLSLLTAILNIVFNLRLAEKMWYTSIYAGFTIFKEPGVKQNQTPKLAESFILQFLTYVILYNNLIPISLQVTLEFVKFVQAFFINWDLDMYHEETNQPAVARTSNLNEELGQIKYIFSDKTGTLTRNVMEFKGCSVGEVMYVAEATSNEERQSFLGSNVKNFSDMLNAVRHGDGEGEKVDRFMTMITICHTVVPERTNDGTLVYQASSPDEAALVKGAAELGWTFQERSPQTITINNHGLDETYQVLNVIDFTSSRKRMSVIVQDEDGNIKLICKGADTVIFERLSPEERGVPKLMEHLDQFATVGLRTLCLAEAVLSEAAYRRWSKKYAEASISIQNREAKIAEVAELIEKNLHLVGATAVEDKLQLGVPDCIASLAKADIKIWVLTGDKQETALNIGRSCALITAHMPVVFLNTQTAEETKEQLATLVKDFTPVNSDHNVALIVDGHSLRFALDKELVPNFLKIAVSCRAVICCRVSPLQKAEVVTVVRKYVGAITLAIGDGANDVGMIQAADVGIGISGLEGTQAVNSADYAIAQFRFLKKLLLVHGSWDYYRICKLILYSFYKNICLYVIELWFQFNNGFSGQIIFERWSIGLYNVAFTFIPPLTLGLIDKYTDKRLAMKFPQLYKISQDSTLFNVKVFWMWMFTSIYHSLLLYYIPVYLLFHNGQLPNGTVGGYLYVGNEIYGYTVIVVCLKLGLETYAWTWLHIAALVISVGSWFIFVFTYSQLWPVLPLGAAEEMAGQGTQLFSNPTFWLGCFLIPLIVLLRDIIWKIIRRTFFVSIKEQVELYEKEVKSRKPHDPVPTTRRGLEQMTNTAFAKIFAPAATYQFIPSESSQIHVTGSPSGFAFSQDEHGAVRQSELVKILSRDNQNQPR